MTEDSLLTINVEIPFPTNRTAELAYHVLRVDAEPKKTVQKEVTHKENLLIVKFQGSSSKQLRVAVNSLFENIALISETLDAFEHTPAPTPNRAVYGFILALSSKLLFTIYVLWAVIPETWFEAIGITYLIDRYWAIVIPIFLLTVLGLFVFIIYPSLGLIMTPNWNDLRTVSDEYSDNKKNSIAKSTFVKIDQNSKSNCYCNSGRACKKNIFENHDNKEYERRKIPKLQDLNIIDVSKHLYLKFE
ncbi:phosphatidylinositol n-acetylglucosaminyltransferase subunit p [Holotrichia oblita]|uniref:Phosphatidylinositol n-acetylglucosaminyltransferase subunit p n=1 Tax=Holotrichia oblita TaxID=644536 RepID=A0ACB9TCR6_HOLOL|nr:phosphatidylinositol n-acetylglucosaminyltransferase subunit p [Holotrichia oblita]